MDLHLLLPCVAVRWDWRTDLPILTHYNFVLDGIVAPFSLSCVSPSDVLEEEFLGGTVLTNTVLLP